MKPDSLISFRNAFSELAPFPIEPFILNVNAQAWALWRIDISILEAAWNICIEEFYLLDFHSHNSFSRV